MEHLVEILKHPPGWITFILVSFFVSKAIKEVIHVFNETAAKNKSDHIIILEIILTIVLAIITLHTAFEGNFGHGGGEGEYSLMKFLGLFVIATLCSMLLLMIHHEFSKKK